VQAGGSVAKNRKREITNILWTKFVKDKPNWDKEFSTKNLEEQLTIIETVKNVPINE